MVALPAEQRPALSRSRKLNEFQLFLTIMKKLLIIDVDQ